MPILSFKGQWPDRWIKVKTVVENFAQITIAGNDPCPLSRYIQQFVGVARSNSEQPDCRKHLTGNLGGASGIVREIRHARRGLRFAGRKGQHCYMA
jgi:hypothetical protein